MTDYCSAIAAVMTESRKIPSPTAGMDDRECGRISIQRKILHRQVKELQTQAAKEFAVLNGWRYSERGFATKTLARGGTHETREEWLWRSNPLYLLDHGIYFRETSQPYRPVAIVGQPYESATSVAKGIELAHSLGLELHAPPNSVSIGPISATSCRTSNLPITICRRSEAGRPQGVRFITRLEAKKSFRL
jgi:hypothetical protein